jgi:hypothetical protein
MSAENTPPEFSRLAARFRVRRPVSHRRELESMNSGYGFGVCLDGLLPRDARVWLDESQPAAGDLVVIEYSNDWIRKVLEAVERESPEWQEKWRRTDLVDGELPRCALKLFELRDGVPWLVCNQYSIRLARVGRVIGVVRHVELGGVPVLGSRGALRAQIARAAFPILAAALGAVAAVVFIGAKL